MPGASSQDGLRATFQPSLPYPLSQTTNLFVRPAIPLIISQDVPNAAGGFDSKGVDLDDDLFGIRIHDFCAGHGGVKVFVFAFNDLN